MANGKIQQYADMVNLQMAADVFGYQSRFRF
jgi:hypothetical protein